MDNAFPCPWGGGACKLQFPDRVQLDLHVLTSHCEYGHVISNFYHNYNHNLSSFLLRGERKPGNSISCEYADCCEKFDNELQMNTHVVHQHMENIVKFEKNQSIVDQMSLKTVKPENNENDDADVTIDNGIDENDIESPPQSQEYPRKTYCLRKRANEDSDHDSTSDGSASDVEEISIDSEPSGSQLSGEEDDEDDEQVLEQLSDSQDSQESFTSLDCPPDSQASESALDVDPDEVEDLDVTMTDHPEMETLRRSYWIKMKSVNSQQYLCRYGECEVEMGTRRQIEKHFRREHLGITEEMEKMIHAKRTEERRYDEIVKKGLICS